MFLQEPYTVRYVLRHRRKWISFTLYCINCDIMTYLYK